MRTECICAWCGAAFFEHRPSLVAVRRYCSTACYRFGRRRREARTCRWCGGPFEAKVSSVARDFYCGRACYWAERRASPGRQRLRDTPDERFSRLRALFEVRVQRGARPVTDCWHFVGDRDSNGYSIFWYEGRTTKAHRVSAALVVGPIPPSVVVRHQCHNRACVNPYHLLLGSPADNSRDMLEAGRQARGRAFPWTKLNEETVRELRARQEWPHGSRITTARRLGISDVALRKVLRRKSWKHVT